MLIDKFYPDKAGYKIDISAIYINSKLVTPNSIFVCIVGLRNDGHDYIDMAIENGAKVIIHSKEIKKYDGIIYIKVFDTDLELNRLTDIFYNYPSKNMTVYAVTGTNGKTTTAYIIEEILSHFEKIAYNGTIGTKIDGKLIEGNHMTTPDNIHLTKLLSDVKSMNVTSVALEISSHALEQKRAYNVDVDAAIYTNLTHEHLDYHKTMDGYLNAKQLLFKNLKPTASAVLNIDDSYYKNFAEASPCKIISYGQDDRATFKISNINMLVDKTSFTLTCPNGVYNVQSSLVSLVNVYNLTAALVAIHSQGYTMEELLQYTSSINMNIGRFQSIPNSHCNIIVDYAHTPDGFLKIYEFAKSITKKENKIITVFGSAGQRDLEKRPIFGELSDKFCDYIILCEDDYRDEDPTKIALDILKGISDKSKVKIIIDRYKAIYEAIKYSKKDDTILILSKGLDKFLPKGDKDVFWMGDDIAAIKALDELK